jgi:hypothetical protein
VVSSTQTVHPGGSAGFETRCRFNHHNFSMLFLKDKWRFPFLTILSTDIHYITTAIQSFGDFDDQILLTDLVNGQKYENKPLFLSTIFLIFMGCYFILNHCNSIHKIFLSNLIHGFLFRDNFYFTDICSLPNNSADAILISYRQQL